jgi:sugar O-acyltransferase (sialic acid O-acetyltransferase NeuD family)
MKNELILVGGGGHCKACIDVIEQEGKYTIAGVVDTPEKIGQMILSHRIIGSDVELPNLAQEFAYFLIAIGQIKSARRRVEIFNGLKRLGAKLPVVVSPRAYVSPHAFVDEGTIVMHGAVVNSCARVACNCIINSHAIVEHDAIIDSHCHISTGAIVNGGAHIKEQSFIGSQAMIKHGIEIGECSIIGAGMSVLSNVAPGTLLR